MQPLPARPGTGSPDRSVDIWSGVKLAYRRAALIQKVAAATAISSGLPSAVQSAPILGTKTGPRRAQVGPKGNVHHRTGSQAAVDAVSIHKGPEIVAEKGSKLEPLLPHQRAGIDFVMGHGGSGLLIHPTGSGKTRTASEIGKQLRLKSQGRTLYVVPAALRTNMAKGVAHWTPETRVQIVRHGNEAVPMTDAAVVSYELFKKRGPEFAKAGYDSLVFDEIQKSKDEDTGTYRQMAKLRPLFKHAVGLTASLNSLDPSDMIQPINVITGGRHDLGTREQFKGRYLKTRAEDVGWLGAMRLSPIAAKEVVGFKNEHELGRRLRNYIHYVSTDELDPELFPKKETERVEVEMSTPQMRLYRAALRQLPPEAVKVIDSDGREGDIAKIYNTLIQARALSGGVHTMVPGLSLSDSWRLTPKASKVVDDVKHHLAETKDGQIVIVSNLVRGGIDVLAQAMKDNGIPFGVFMGKGKGGQTETDRQAALKAYQAGETKVLLISPAGHEGIDAPDTTMVAGYDAHFNPEHILQQEARGVRARGQSARPQAQRRVVVRRYISVMPESRGLFASIKKALGFAKRERSIDEKVYGVAEGRHQLNQGVLDILRDREPQQHQL